MIDSNELNQNAPNILIVDDVPANLKILGEILKREGYRVRPVPSGALALQVAEKEKPDLILLDIMMPMMDGYEVCARIKQNPDLCEIPIIFISALNETKDIVKALRAGGVDYITKPFQSEEVLARASTHIKMYRQSRELEGLIATKDKFFSIIAHDLRGPIGSMMQISDLIAEKGKVDEETLYFFLESQKELSKSTFHLLENLLNWAKSNTNQIEFDPKELDIETIVKAIITNFNIQSTSKNITINTDFPERYIEYADENMVRLIIRNLVSNAIKFTPDGGEINIFTKSGENNSVIVGVKDSGIGIPQRTLENLFRIGVNKSRPGTNGESSNGLGLLLCKEFVVKHGGSIWVESEEGVGTTFYFTLPNQE